MHVRKPALLLTTGALALSPFLASSALGADSTVGASFSPPGTCQTDTTYVQTGTATSNYRVPSDGVITSWQFVPGATLPANVAVKVARAGAAANQFQIVGSGPLTAVSGTNTVSGKVRIATRVGDLLGVSITGAASPNCARSVAGSTIAYLAGDLQPGTYTLTAQTGYEMDISAVLEPDADGDGFGDVSQDLCPTNKAIQTVCTGPERVAPETSITSVVAKKAKSLGKKASVSVAFVANETSTFECAVDSPTFVPCASPFTTKLKVGRHTIAVRATDAAGNVDKSAAVASVKVKVGTKK